MKTQELNGILRDNLERMFPQASVIQSETQTKPVTTIFNITLSTAERLAPNVIWKTLKQQVGKIGKSAVECEYGSEPHERGNIDIIARVGTDTEHCRMCIRTVLEETPQKLSISTIEPPPRH